MISIVKPLLLGANIFNKFHVINALTCRKSFVTFHALGSHTSKSKHEKSQLKEKKRSPSKSVLPDIKPDLSSYSTKIDEIESDFATRIVSRGIFPDVRVLANRCGTGGRSSFNGLVVTVFGATGFLARSVVNGLARIGSTVVCPYRSDQYKLKELKLAGDLGQIWFVPFDLRDEATIRRAMQHSNVVINLIGRDHITPNFSFDDVHVDAARTIARIAAESGIRRFIHVSALNSSPSPPKFYVKGGSKFLKSKYYGELAVREEFPDSTIFRPADMYGVMDRYLWYYSMFYRRRYRRLPIHNGGYGITKTPVSVSDVAQGIVNALSDEDSIGQTYDAVGPRRYELRLLLQYLQDVTEKIPDTLFVITNLRFDPIMRFRISMLSFLNKIVLRHPKVCWEKIERECYSDENPSNPTLTDLGVRLSLVEDKWPSHLKIWRFDWSYDGDLGEKKLYENPPFIPEERKEKNVSSKSNS